MRSMSRTKKTIEDGITFLDQGARQTVAKYVYEPGNGTRYEVWFAFYRDEEAAMARKKKQTEIPGVEREADEELDDAAARVYELTAERQAKHDEEKEARTALVELMRAKDVTRYVYVDGEERFDVILEESSRVKVRKAKAGAD